MESVILGKTGRLVSRLGFGGGPAGIANYLSKYDPEIKQDREKVIAAIHRALELGITYFDTAAGYGNGESECIFGESLDGWPEDKIFLATKMSSTQGSNVRPLLEKSLRNLRRNSVDLLQIHSPSRSHEGLLFEKNGMLDQLIKLQEEGQIKYLGFTMEEQSPLLYRLINLEIFSVMQIEYNVIFQHPYDPFFKTGCMFDAESKGLGIVAMRSMTSGILQRFIQVANPDNTFDYSPAILQFELGNPLIDVVLVGMRSIARVERNVAIVSDTAHRIYPEMLHLHIVN
jgi:uncharacterized protein